VAGRAAGADQLDHRRLRQSKPFTAAFDDQRRDDGQCQRNLDREVRAHPAAGRDFDHAADLLDIGADDVHADAAP
jgi:hypothetical protein